MNLKEVRQWLVDITGRMDLINEDGTDNGANRYINAGQRFLDRRIDFKKSPARYFDSLAIDAWYLKLNGCRTLDRVWVNDSEERWQLERKDLLWLHNEYADLISETDSGDPLYWAPAILRGAEITDIDDQGAFFNYVLAESGNEDYVGIVILPPTDAAITVELWGMFYSPTFSDPDDESYWSVVAPETLVKAAAYQIETMYRNRQGSADWLSALDIELVDLDKDEVHEGVTNVDQMEG